MSCICKGTSQPLSAASWRLCDSTSTARHLLDAGLPKGHVDSLSAWYVFLVAHESIPMRFAKLEMLLLRLITPLLLTKLVIARDVSPNLLGFYSTEDVCITFNFGYSINVEMVDEDDPARPSWTFKFKCSLAPELDLWFFMTCPPGSFPKVLYGKGTCRNPSPDTIGSSHKQFRGLTFVMARDQLEEWGIDVGPLPNDEEHRLYGYGSVSF